MAEMNEVKVEKKFKLPNEKVQVEFIKREKGNVKNKNHVLYGGMLEGSSRTLSPRRSSTTFKYEKVLTDEEQKFLEKKLGTEKEGLNVYKKDNNYWDSVTVILKKEGISLDLSDPIDYIRYKILLSYTDLVAPSIDAHKLKNKLTYSFVIVHKGDRENEKVIKYNVTKEAYSIASKLDLSTEKTREFLYLYGVRVSGDASVKWIKGKLAQVVEDDPGGVVDLYTSGNYETRSLLARGVLCGVIKDVGNKFYLEDGVALAAENEISSLANSIKFLDDPVNSDIRMRVEAKIG